MAVDWDAELLAPVMGVFGQGDPADQSTWPTFIGGGVTLPLPGAVFDAAYRQVEELADGSQANTEHPVLGVRAALFGASLPQQGGKIIIPGRTPIYAIADVRADGHGHILLILIESQ